MSLGPFDLTGGRFLILYVALLAATAIAGFIIPRLMRPTGRAQRVTGEYQLAYLAGGSSRFADAVVARLLAAGALTMIGRDSFSVVSRDAATSAAELDVLGLPSPFQWDMVERKLESEAEPLERRMVASGLLMSEARVWHIRFWVILPFLMLLIFGVTKWVIGDLRDRPVGFLTILLIATAFCAMMFSDVDRRTRAGHDALARVRRKAERLEVAPANTEIGLAVALFGTTVLAGSGWSDFHRLRSANGGCSGSGDGGGCGGGCGGCGD